MLNQSFSTCLFDPAEKYFHWLRVDSVFADMSTYLFLQSFFNLFIQLRTFKEEILYDHLQHFRCLLFYLLI